MLNATPTESKLERRTDQQQEPKRLTGEIMKKKYASILLTLICLLGLGVTAAAQGRGEIVVTLPFEFVASGKTLPAGRYTLSRVSDDKFDGLILSSYQNRTSVFVHPIEAESAPADKPHLSFDLPAAPHFLTNLQTSNNLPHIPLS